MKFMYTKIEDIPKLAWCACIEKEFELVDIYHGSSVEVRKDFFVEGVWDGEFSQGDFESATFFLGSGAKFTTNGSLIFSINSASIPNFLAASTSFIILSVSFKE